MKRHALIIGKVWPEPGSSAAGRHMLEIMQALQAGSWQLTFATAAVDAAFSADLQKLSVQTQIIAVNDNAFDDWLIELNPQLVIFDRFMTEEQFGWRVSKHCPDALRVLDSEDLHFLRDYRQGAAGEYFGRAVRPAVEALEGSLALREIASIYRSDLTLMISQAEITLLQNSFQIPPTLLHYFPFVTQVPAAAAKQGFEQRQGFVFVGTLMHKPNQQAVRLLKKTIWPAIRAKRPQARLQIVGSYMSDEFLQMHKPSEGFEVLGRVEDLSRLLHQSRVCLAPLMFGAGLKGKLVEAMEHGLPSVTTAVGAEGIAAVEQWPGRVVDSVELFIEAAVKLETDETFWQQSQQRGFAMLETAFSKHHLTNLNQRILQVLEDLPLHRRKHFMGRMLQHHFLASTEYMSRWITAKNR